MINRFVNTSRTAALLVSLLAALPSTGQAQVTFTGYLGPSTPTFSSDDTMIAITSGPDGNLWFTENYAFGAQTQIGRITPTGVTTYFDIPSGSSEGGITTGPDGNLWFTEYRTSKIAKVTTSGAFTEFTTPSGGRPTAIAAGPNGNLWFTSYYANTIGRITPTGVVTEFAKPTAGYDFGITAGPDGNLWFTETSANQIGRITTSGVITEFPIPTSNCYPVAITAGPDGNLWFVEADGNKIGRITPDGEITEFAVPTPDSQPLWGITTGPDRNLWFTEDNGNNLGRITTDGVITEYPVPSPGRCSGITTGPDGNLWFLEMRANKIVKVVIGATLAPTSLTVNNVSGLVGQKKNLTAQLRRSDTNAPLAGESVTFKVDGGVVGSGVTNATGHATFSYTLPESLGDHALTAEFAGDSTYAASASPPGTLTVNFANTLVTATDRTAQAGDTFNLIADLKRVGDGGVANRTLTFSVNGTQVGTAVTNTNGRATLSYTAPLAVGSFPIAGSFDGDAFYGPSGGSGTLTLTTAATKLTAANKTVKLGRTVTLQARLKRTSDGAFLVGQTVRFTVNGQFMGTGTTDGGGFAYLLYTATGPQVGVETFPILAEFAGDSVDLPSSDTATLTVNP